MGSIVRRATVQTIDTDLLQTEVDRVLRAYHLVHDSEAE
jgi:hypothetical protein